MTGAFQHFSWEKRLPWTQFWFYHEKDESSGPNLNKKSINKNPPCGKYWGSNERQNTCKQVQYILCLKDPLGDHPHPHHALKQLVVDSRCIYSWSFEQKEDSCQVLQSGHVDIYHHPSGKFQILEASLPAKQLVNNASLTWKVELF